MCAGCVLVGLLILVSLCGTFNLASGCFLTAPPSFLQERKKLLILYWGIEGLPGGSDGKGSAYNVGDLGSIPGLGRSPGEGEWLLTPVFLPGEFHGQEPGGLHGVEKSSTWLNN